MGDKDKFDAFLCEGSWQNMELENPIFKPVTAFKNHASEKCYMRVKKGESFVDFEITQKQFEKFYG